MRFESQWPGDAIAAPVYGMYDPEDALFDCLGGRSWNGVDRRSDLADADPTAVVLNDWLSRSNRRKDCRPLVTSEKHYRLCDPVGGIRYAQGLQRT
jgi:hypothetical protein